LRRAWGSPKLSRKSILPFRGSALSRLPSRPAWGFLLACSVLAFVRFQLFRLASDFLFLFIAARELRERENSSPHWFGGSCIAARSSQSVDTEDKRPQVHLYAAVRADAAQDYPTASRAFALSREMWLAPLWEAQVYSIGEPADTLCNVGAFLPLNPYGASMSASIPLREGDRASRATVP
jgi:hypothetical protein